MTGAAANSDPSEWSEPDLAELLKGKFLTVTQAYTAMEYGLSVRRPCWKPGYYMLLNADGIEETRDSFGNVISLGYRSFSSSDEPDDFEIVTPVEAQP